MEELNEGVGGLGALVDDAPLGGEIAPPEVYTPIETPPISPHFAQTISETAKEFLGTRLKTETREGVIEALGATIVEALKQSAERRLDKDRSIVEWKRALELEAPDRESSLGEDGPNIRTPLVWKIHNALHAFFLEALTGIRPYIKTEPMFGGDLTVPNKIEGYYDGLYEEQVRLASKLDMALSMALADGTAILAPKWERNVRMMFKSGVISPQTAPFFGLEVTGDGRFNSKKQGRSYSSGSVFSGLVEAVEKDAPEIDCVSYFNFFMCPATSVRVEDATIAGQRMFKTIDWVRRNVRSNVFSGKQQLAMEESGALRHISDLWPTNLTLGELPESGLESSSEISSDMQEQQVIAKGTQRRVEIFDGVIRFDGDGDDIDETWAFTIECSTGVILRLQEYGCGELMPFQPLCIFPRPGKFYGMPLGQILAGLQDESDMTANLIIEAAMLANTMIVEEGEGVRSPLSTEDLTVGLNKFSVSAKAGEGFAVHQLAPNVQSGLFPARDTVDAMASDATAASETLIGRVSERSGTTAYETNQALINGARRLKVGVDRNREAVWKTHTILHALCTHYHALKSGGNPEYKIPYPTRVGGAKGFMEMTLLEFLSPVRFFVLGDGINTDKALHLQAAEKLYLMSERSPFIQAKRERQYAVAADFLSAYGKSDYLNFIGTISEARKDDEEAAQKAQDPMATLQDLPPNAQPEYVALMLARSAPEAQQAYLQMLSAIYAAQENAKAEAASSEAEQQMELMKVQHGAEIAKLKTDAAVKDVQHTMEKGKMQVERQIEGAKASNAVAVAQHNAQMQVSTAKQDAAQKVAQSRTRQQQSKSK